MGVIGARNMLATVSSSASARKNSMIAGGAITPSVPAAAITPLAVSGRYRCASMVGIAATAIVATDAPITPAMGASNNPIRMTEMHMLPGTRAKMRCRQRSSSRAAPLISSATPMNRSIGTAG